MKRSYSNKFFTILIWINMIYSGASLGTALVFHDISLLLFGLFFLWFALFVCPFLRNLLDL